MALNRTIPGLDIARFSAAFMVMLYHLAAVSWAVPETITAQILQGAAKYPEIFSFSWFGFVGVEIFFVISGFVITVSAEATHPKRFLRSRIARLYPAVWLCAPLSALALWLSGVQGNVGILKELLKSFSLYPFPQWIDGVYWTLGIEMMFYLVVLILLIFHAFNRIQLFAYVIGATSAFYWIFGFYFMARIHSKASMGSDAGAFAGQLRYLLLARNISIYNSSRRSIDIEYSLLLSSFHSELNRD